MTTREQACLEIMRGLLNTELTVGALAEVLGVDPHEVAQAPGLWHVPRATDPAPHYVGVTNERVFRPWLRARRPDLEGQYDAAEALAWLGDWGVAG